jgi:head-tail adaptor
MTYPAGSLTGRVRFERREAALDGYGNTEGDWVEVASMACGYRPTSAREGVEQGALAATTLGVLTVHQSPSAKAVRANDRALIVAGPYAGTEAQVRSIVVRPDNASVEMIIETGVAL